jgi:hypothetical protein
MAELGAHSSIKRAMDEQDATASCSPRFINPSLLSKTLLEPGMNEFLQVLIDRVVQFQTKGNGELYMPPLPSGHGHLQILAYCSSF